MSKRGVAHSVDESERRVGPDAIAVAWARRSGRLPTGSAGGFTVFDPSLAHERYLDGVPTPQRGRTSYRAARLLALGVLLLAIFPTAPLWMTAMLILSMFIQAALP